jgi:hypothetical protein
VRDHTSSRLLRALLILAAAALVLGLAHAGIARGGELDHYSPAVNNVRDFLLPDRGVYGALYTLDYHTDDFRNRNGNSVDSLRIAGRDLRLDVDLDLHSIIPLVIWSSGFKLLGAEYGAYAAIPKWRLSSAAKYPYEFYAVDRFRGQTATVSAAYKF